MANSNYGRARRQSGRLSSPFGPPNVPEEEDPYETDTPMASIDPRSNPYGQGGGLRGRLRDALLAGGSAGHNRNRMAPVMNARMFDRGMAPEQQNYMAEQRAQQTYQQNQTDRVDRKKNQVSAYTDYLRNAMTSGQGVPMSMRSWLSLPEGERAQYLRESVVPTQSNPYETVRSKGLFTGTQGDWNGLSSADQSKLISAATTPIGSGGGKKWMSREEIFNEFTAGDFTPESFQGVLESGDTTGLVRKGTLNGVTPETAKAETDLRKEYNIEMEMARDVQDSYTALTTALNLNSGIGDTGAIFKLMKGLDPRSTVRESEFDAVARSSGKFEEWRNTMNNITDGVILTSESRALVDELGYTMVMNTRRQAENSREQYNYLVERRGLDRRSVMGNRGYDYDNVPRYKLTKKEEETLETASKTLSERLMENARLLASGGKIQ